MGSLVNTLKSHLNQFNQTMRRYQGWTGETVLWAEFDPAHSSEHPIYHEGPSRWWKIPVALPVMFITLVQGVEMREGLYPVQTATITFQVEAAQERFSVDPLDTDGHYRDRFSYGTWPQSHVFTVTDYQKQGLVRGEYLTISVKGVQVMPEEFADDIQPESFFIQGGGSL